MVELEAGWLNLKRRAVERMKWWVGLTNCMQEAIFVVVLRSEMRCVGLMSRQYVPTNLLLNLAPNLM